MIQNQMPDFNISIHDTLWSPKVCQTTFSDNSRVRLPVQPVLRPLEAADNVALANITTMQAVSTTSIRRLLSVKAGELSSQPRGTAYRRREKKKKKVPTPSLQGHSPLQSDGKLKREVDAISSLNRTRIGTVVFPLFFPHHSLLSSSWWLRRRSVAFSSLCSF